MGDYVAGDKIQGITLEQYQAGLMEREQQVVARLKESGVSPLDAKALRETLQRIDARQANIQASYRDVERLTAEIRTYHENVADKQLVEQAVLDIFDGNNANAAGKALEAGIPIETVPTIEATQSIFQEIRTKADFLKFVTERDLILSDNTNYKRLYGRNGSIEGFSVNLRSGTGSWAWVNGEYCEEFKHRDDHYPQYCPDVFVSNSGVKFEYESGDTAIYSKE
ncbi:hypothetical protein ACERZ8_01190 [Tateyamaria armeniaca]|uniref:Uncharacterized protein n=1 Tax=Tateyamaria armeniaca TaxID=2518930 RepID=A0ABW8USD1_9RHOB